MTVAPARETRHATTVAIGGRAVLIEGRSGAGKSDLALRLIDRGAQLVSDDYTVVTRDETGCLLAAPPPTIAGRMEVRGIGIIEMPYRADVPVALVVTLTATPDRLPLTPLRCAIVGMSIPCILLPALEPSATIKVELALTRLGLPTA